MNKSVSDRLEILYNKEDAKRAEVAIEELVKNYNKYYLLDIRERSELF